MIRYLIFILLLAIQSLNGQEEIKNDIFDLVDETSHFAGCETNFTNNLEPWIPGKKNGKSVKVKYTLSPMFKLDESKENYPIEIDTFKNDEIFVVSEIPPILKGCEQGELSEQKKCSDEHLSILVGRNLKYPPEARKKGVKGQVMLEFIIDEFGNVSDSKILRDIGGGCGPAALNAVKVLEDMNSPWIPAKQRGKPVKFRYTLPVRFNL